MGEFALASVGADYLIEENLLAGVALHGDWIGLNQGLTLYVSVFYGRSWNDAAATVAGIAYSGRFETERLLLKAKLEGTWQADALTIRPNATFVLGTEQAGAYAASAATDRTVLMPGFDETDYRLGLGATFEYAYLLDNGIELTPQLGHRSCWRQWRGGGRPSLQSGLRQAHGRHGPCGRCLDTGRQNRTRYRYWWPALNVGQCRLRLAF